MPPTAMYGLVQKQKEINNKFLKTTWVSRYGQLSEVPKIVITAEYFLHFNTKQNALIINCNATIFVDYL